MSATVAIGTSAVILVGLLVAVWVFRDVPPVPREPVTPRGAAVVLVGFAVLAALFTALEYGMSPIFGLGIVALPVIYFFRRR